MYIHTLAFAYLPFKGITIRNENRLIQNVKAITFLIQKNETSAIERKLF